MRSHFQLVCSEMRSLAATYMLVLTLCFSPFSYAQTQQPSAQKKEINKTQAANKAKQMVKGRVLRVEQGKKNYRVKMLKKSGRVVSVSVDKQSGKVVETKKSGKKD